MKTRQEYVTNKSAVLRTLRPAAGGCRVVPCGGVSCRVAACRVGPREGHPYSPSSAYIRRRRRAARRRGGGRLPRQAAARHPAARPAHRQGGAARRHRRPAGEEGGGGEERSAKVFHIIRIVVKIIIYSKLIHIEMRSNFDRNIEK